MNAHDKYEECSKMEHLSSTRRKLYLRTRASQKQNRKTFTKGRPTLEITFCLVPTSAANDNISLAWH